MLALNPSLAHRVTLPVRPAAHGIRAACATLHRWSNALILGLVPIQVYLAGAVMFGASGLMPHRVTGFVLLLLSLLSALLASVARRPFASARLAFVLFGLMFLQPLLATGLRSISAALAALHAVNALAIFGVALLIAVRQRRAGVPA